MEPFKRLRRHGGASCREALFPGGCWLALTRLRVWPCPRALPRPHHVGCARTSPVCRWRPPWHHGLLRPEMPDKHLQRTHCGCAPVAAPMSSPWRLAPRPSVGRPGTTSPVTYRHRVPVVDIVGRRTGGIDPHLPPLLCRVERGRPDRREHEIERLPVGIAHQVDPLPARKRSAEQGQRMRGDALIRRAPVDAMEFDAPGSSAALAACLGFGPALAVVQAGGDHHLDEAVDVRMPVEQPPVEPADLVVLAVRVVVAAPACAAPRRPSGSAARPSTPAAA